MLCVLNDIAFICYSNEKLCFLSFQTKKKLDELTKQPELASKILCGADSSSSSKQASDISHLVKRKRKDEEDDEESNPPKKSQ